MSHNIGRARPPLHGYQPLVVDEDCLGDAGRREAIVNSVVEPCDWKSHVTREEWESLEKELAEIQKRAEVERRNTPGLVYAGEPREMEEKRLELVRRGSFRAFARQKYADGGSVWYGDGLPPWER